MRQTKHASLCARRLRGAANGQAGVTSARGSTHVCRRHQLPHGAVVHGFFEEPVEPARQTGALKLLWEFLEFRGSKA